MTASRLLKDLVVLTADKNARFALQGILTRYHSLGIRQLTLDYYLHPGKDPGIFHSAHDFLRPFSKSYAHALVLMDHEGSGQEELSCIEMETKIETALGLSGWEHRAAVLVIEPELDIWVWSDSPHVDRELGWSGREPDIRSWLKNRNLLQPGAVKPDRPKEALEAALKQVRKPRSSALYQAIAEKVSLVKCTDPAFLKLKAVLQRWFA